MRDIQLMLRCLKEHYKLKTDKALADFLGVKAATLSNWVARMSIDYDLLYTKCEGIDANWLLTGKGKMFLEAGDGESYSKVNESQVEYVRSDIFKDKYIRTLEKQVEMLDFLKEDLQQKNEIIQGFLDGKITKM